MHANDEHTTPLDWLLEPDPANPGVRYFALRHLLGRPADDPDVVSAQADVMRTGPVPATLAAQDPEGYWVKPGPGYGPKYRGTVWSLIFLGQLGADGRDPRVRRAIDYVLDHAMTKAGAFSVNGAPSGAIHCLWGNLVRAMLDLGAWGDARLAHAIDGLGRSITGDGYDDYRTAAMQGPWFLCAANFGLPCGWGAVRALWALNAVPAEGRTPVVEAGIRACVEFLQRYDIARADYPYQKRISPNWFKFGYPLGYVTDVLLNLEALAEAGVAGDPRLNDAIALVLSKRDAQGRWTLEYGYQGKMWFDVEQKGRPSKWVTLRAMRALQRLGVEAAPAA